MRITPRRPKEAGREYALRILKDNIVQLGIEPGSMLSENELAAALGLSRTPVREALIELSKTGIVEVLPQTGSRVVLIDYELVEEARFLRLILEEAIVKIACTRVTDEQLNQLEEILMLQEFHQKNQQKEHLMNMDDYFHRMLFEIAGMLHTYDAMQNLEIHFDRVRALSFNVVKNMRIVQDHRAIYEALRRRDGEQAQALIRKHLTQYSFDRKSICETYPQYVTAP